MPANLFARFDETYAKGFSDNLMLEEFRRLDWSRSPLGMIENWPDAIRHAARTMLLSPTPMTVLVGREGRLLYNDAAAEIFGPAYAGALGRPIEEILPEAAAFYRNAIDRCFEGRGVGFRDQPIRLFRQCEWRTAWFRLAFTPIADEVGAIFGVLLIASESTEQIRALRDLQLSRERLDLTLRHGGIVGTWEVDFTTETITCDQRFARLHGVDPDAARGRLDKDAFIAGIHPDDRHSVMLAFDEAKASREDYRLQHRVIGEGMTRWIVASGRMFSDEAGRLTHFMGVVVDVTEQVKVADALARSEQLFKALADTVPPMIFSTQADGEPDYLNSRWYEFTGEPAGAVSLESWLHSIHPEDQECAHAEWRDAVASGERYDLEYRLRHHSGEFRWTRAMALPLRDSKGFIVRWFGTHTDIHEAKLLATERELVAGELEHRIKNLFALVNGLVVLSARDAPEMAPFAETLQQRLMALHQAHDLIRSSGCENGGAASNSASLHRLVRTLLGPYDDEGGDRVVLEGDDMIVDPAAVTPLALVFHELATNATKYGALSAAQGVLHIGFQREDERMRIRWMERGSVPLSPSSERIGFGSRLLSLAVERQLKGAISRSQTPDGLIVELTLPVGTH